MAIRKTVIVTTENVTRIYTNGKAASRYFQEQADAGRKPEATVRFDDMRNVPKQTRRDYYRRTRRLRVGWTRKHYKEG